MPSIQDIPLEIFLDYLLPIIPLKDLLSLAKTNSFFSVLCSDNTFWKNKLKDDLNYSITDARDTGFKFLYRGIRRPSAYVWGSEGEGRLGLGNTRKHFIGHGSALGGIPYPVELKIANARIVSIVAGGWSFHALDDSGKIYVWGTLNGESFALRADGYAESTQSATTPVSLKLPVAITSVSCGRAHAVALDAKSQVWVFRSWGRPYCLISPAIDNTSADSRVVQVEAGWGFIAVLTETGNAFVAWPFSDELERKWQDHDMAVFDQPEHSAPVDGSGIIACAPWEVNFDPLELPPLPNDLPLLSTEEPRGDNIKLVHIAAGDNFIIGLTNRGHVLKIDLEDGTDDDGTLQRKIRQREIYWKYMPKFSEVEHVRSHPTFASPNDERQTEKLVAPEFMRISHVSAHFKTFVAYSTGASSVVIMGTREIGNLENPTIHPSLQNRQVISVVLGDYHFGALTESGELYTWGAYSSGALGLGDPTRLPIGAPGGFTTAEERERSESRRLTVPAVKEPTLVRFDHQDGKPDKFCFAVAASGWHCAALVIDLKPNDPPSSSAQTSDDTKDEYHPRMPGAFETPPFNPGPGGRRIIGMPIEDPRDVPMMGIHPFRVGFAGRGANVGGGRVLQGGFRGLPRGARGRGGVSYPDE